MTGIDHPLRFERGSFRDRSGRILYSSDSVLRVLSEEALSTWEALSKTTFFRQQCDQGSIVQTERLDDEARAKLPVKNEWPAVLRHERIPFISYPYEWSFSMLKDAALLQLNLLLSSLKERFTLKDATPYNVQWKGTQPVFIDVLSFKPLEQGEPWTGYRQFCQMHLYPLFLTAYKEIPYQQWMRGSIDGIPVEHFARIMTVRDLFRRGVFIHAYLQNKLQSKFANSQSDVRSGLKSIGFNEELIRRNVLGLRKTIETLQWKRNRSEWSEYVSDNLYSAEDQKKKTEFVQFAVQSRSWDLVWDLGCNTGVFSRIAAQNSDYVVAMDGDHFAVERLYRDLRKERANNILPLVMNLADSSQGLGWRGQERKSLVERGKPDLVLCLALIHHMVISTNIPLAEFVNWLADLGGAVVIEFPSKEDPMVKRLLRNKDDQYSEYSIGSFEHSVSHAFQIKKREELSTRTRVLYFLAPKVQ